MPDLSGTPEYTDQPVDEGDDSEMAVRADLAKYNENQERDSHGRFGSGSEASNGASKFSDKGGKISQSLDKNDSKVNEAKNGIEEMSSKLGFDFAIDPGVMQALEAVGGIKYGEVDLQGDKVIVAYDKNNDIAGALSYTEKTYPNGGTSVFIDHAGSTGILQGTGSALTQSVIDIAASKGSAIELNSLPDARGFWEKMGFDNYFGGSIMNMTPEVVQARASK
jgi:hypothetical protein